MFLEKRPGELKDFLRQSLLIPTYENIVQFNFDIIYKNI